MYELVNIFDSFLPQLLTYPNPSDPLNLDAANMMNSSLPEYTQKVKLLVREHAVTASSKMEVEEIEVVNKKKSSQHKESTDVDEDQADEKMQEEEKDQVDREGSDFLSHPSDLSSLSDTSDICDEQMF